MRKCTLCLQEKDESEFGKHKNGRDGLRSRCKPCNRIEANQTYKKNPAPYLARARKGAKVFRDAVGLWLDQIRNEAGCCVCGGKEPCTLDFHHVNPEEKIKAITQMIGKGLNSLEAELAKCVVVCANCHRKVHADIVNVEDKPRCVVKYPRSPNRRK